jgi:hypothetical protein
MLFAERSSHLIKLILPHFKNINTYQDEVMSFRTDLDKWFLLLRNNYYVAVKIIKVLSKESFIPKKKKILNNNYEKPEAYNHSSFIPNYIKQYIDNNKQYQISYSTKLNNRNIRVVFTTFKNTTSSELKKMNKWIEQIYSLIYFLSTLSHKKCSKSLTIYLYMTDFKKMTPFSSSETLGPGNVNTGLTRRCAIDNEVVIYREEEWFKVLIHELIHSFGLDFHSSDDERKELNAIFNVKSEYIFEEAYTETWARILNCVICSFHALNDIKNGDDFLLSLNFTLQLERIYSLYQCDKILRLMNLQFKDILKKNKQTSHFREETNVFCYYVLGGILMNNYGHFIKWCVINNKNNNGELQNKKRNMIQFVSTSSNKRNFISFINTAANSLTLENIMRVSSIFKYANDDIQNSLTMTMIETPIK